MSVSLLQLVAACAGRVEQAPDLEEVGASAQPLTSRSPGVRPSDVGKNSCDVCATAAGRDLLVSLPAWFAIDGTDDAIIVRVSTPGVDDVYVVPPADARSFVVEGFDLDPAATVTIYAPGVSPPPKGNEE